MTDTHDLWVEKGRTYLGDFNKKTAIQKLRYWIQEQVIIGALNFVSRKGDIRFILDAGCGFGRITRILCERFSVANIQGSDISDDQLMEAMNRLPRVSFQNWDICQPWIFGPVDLVMVIEVLMHIREDKIESAIKNLAEVSTDFIITVDWWTEDEVDIYAGAQAGFCFIHDYDELFRAQGYELMREKKIPRVDQKLRVWRKKE